ncbi:IS3 family transposase [Clostridium isatidis]|uniref:IS3 family transposase n=1 Tax=Clostridium isatidis TaxID=182773 RepID=UPI003AAAC6D5
MAKGQKYYTEEFRKTIVELYNSGKSLAELSSEYGISKSTINGWIKKAKPITVDKDTTITSEEYQAMLKKMARLEEENEILKKGHGHIRKEVTSIFEFINDHKEEHDITLMCEVLKVSRSSFYKYLNKTESKRSVENKMYEEEILKIYKDSKGRYGAPKIHKVLREERGHAISLKRVQRIMKKLNIKSIIIKKFRPHSSKSKIEAKENVLKRDFSTTTINEKWVTDITYIYTLKDGWCYLASVLDLHTKKIIGYAFSKTMDTELAIKAVENAYITQKPKNTVILHSDLGSQYTSSKFDDYLNEHNIVHSFSGKGCPYDNACIESFHATLKKEEVNLATYYDFDAARLAIFEYIESWYNRKRLHSIIGYMTPQQLEDALRKTA